jgi:hypothetical protein
VRKSKAFKATRWVVVVNGQACEVAITTPSGKRLRAVTRKEIMSHFTRPEVGKLYPVCSTIRITPAPKRPAMRASEEETHG